MLVSISNNRIAAVRVIRCLYDIKTKEKTILTPLDIPHWCCFELREEVVGALLRVPE